MAGEGMRFVETMVSLFLWHDCTTTRCNVCLVHVSKVPHIHTRFSAIKLKLEIGIGLLISLVKLILFTHATLFALKKWRNDLHELSFFFSFSSYYYFSSAYSEDRLNGFPLLCKQLKRIRDTRLVDFKCDRFNCVNRGHKNVILNRCHVVAALFFVGLFRIQIPAADLSFAIRALITRGRCFLRYRFKYKMRQK